MNQKRANHPLKANWQATNDAAFECDENLIEIARFLARRAAERDFKTQEGKQSKKDITDD